MKRIAVMFPGQGSQAVGMGREFYEQYPTVRSLYDLARESLEVDLQTMMFEGPEEQLTETENAQPALLLSSIAAYQLLEKHHIQPVAVVGHSLGEYSALVAAGVLSLEDALPLVHTRGKLMEKAFPKGQGSMMAVLGLHEETIQSVLHQLPSDVIVDIANLNCPGQVVISGSKNGLEQAKRFLTEAGAKRVIPLNVSGPFHSRLMARANDQFSRYINNVEMKDANIPVYANVSAKPVTNHHDIKDLLIQQLSSPVRFEQSIYNMNRENIDAFVEVGNGRVLTGLVRKIDRTIKTFSIQNPKSLQKFLKWYEEE